jgi:hypothetical protein
MTAYKQSDMIDALVLVRDGLTMSLDGINKLLDGPEPKITRKPTEAQFNGQKWVTKEGSRGNYEQVEYDGSPEFKALSEYVKGHDGFCKIYGFKVWFHNNDEKVIDRKR